MPLQLGCKRWMCELVDDLACAIFALTHVVTLMFYTIQVSGACLVACEGGVHGLLPHTCGRAGGGGGDLRYTIQVGPLGVRVWVAWAGKGPALAMPACCRVLVCLSSAPPFSASPLTISFPLVPHASLPTPQATTKMAVEGGYSRPPWLDVSVHALNTAVAWADLLTSKQRSFSRRSERLSSVLVGAYLAYILVCRHMNGRFPYPFLNALPFPSGFVGIVVVGLLIFLSMFRAGKALAARVQRVDSVCVEWVAEQAAGVISLEHADAAVSKGKLL